LKYLIHKKQKGMKNGRILFRILVFGSLVALTDCTNQPSVSVPATPPASTTTAATVAPIVPVVPHDAKATAPKPAKQVKRKSVPMAVPKPVTMPDTIKDPPYGGYEPAIGRIPSAIEEYIESVPVPVDEQRVYETYDVQKLPDYPGGRDELFKYIKAHMQFPALAIENNIQGTVALGFIVERDGSLTNIKILKDPGGGCDQEAIRIVKTMPRWAPGEINGTPVRVKYTLPVRFRLPE
jgi:periplasmic protein TonB